MADGANEFQDQLANSKNKKVHINEIYIHGLKRTKQDLLEPHLRKLHKCDTLGEILYAAEEASRSIKSYDLFSDVEFSLDENNTYPCNGDIVCLEMHVHLKEKPPVYGNVGTKIGNNEASVEGALNIRNVFGRGEHLETVMSSGTRTTNAFYVHLNKPWRGDLSRILQLAVYKSHEQWQSTRSCDERIHGARISFKKDSPTSTHTMAFIYDWREIFKVPKHLPFSSHENAGHNLKAAAKYSYSLNMLDDVAIPTNGISYQGNLEVAGPGGDARFLRTEHRILKAIPLPFSSSLNLTMLTGYLLSKTKSFATDRFYLGGASNMRGFAHDGIGPRPASRAALGGNAIMGLGLGLFFPLYVTKDWQEKPIRGHLFVNAGSLSHDDSSLRNTAISLMATPRLAVGIGLAIKLSVARIEVNYAMPIKSAPYDDLREGLQLGIGINFL